MCGIVGVINLNGQPIQPEIIAKMNQKIRHRGIDDEGYIFIKQNSNDFLMFGGNDSPSEADALYPHVTTGYNHYESNICLGHRRFSIIDLSIGGHQPFFDKDKTCCVIFNGEIYNYIELRDELQKLGHQFHTDSDTEVIVEAYKEWGTESFQHLNGMWALVLYDFKRKILISSRDRVGKKPFYWFKLNDTIYFASEIKSLLEVPKIAGQKAINEDAIFPYLACGQRDLNNSTFYKDIYSLPAASWAVLNEAFPANIQQYWRLPDKRMKESDISIASGAEAIRETLSNAVEIRLRADVPWAVELSGGMDSSAVVALASQIYQKPITTYTVRYSDKRWNEEPFARSVAERFGTNYQVVDSPIDNFWHEIHPFTYLEEEPYHAPNVHTSQILRRLMRADGIKMFLNGSAGDELFAGYKYYYSNFQIDNLRTGKFKHYFQNTVNWSEGGVLRALIYPFGKRYTQMMASQSREFKHVNRISGISNAPCIEATSLSKRLFNDFVNYRIPYWVRVGDKTQMGIPIEARNPFLDYRMIDLVSTLPETYLIRHGWHKWILRKALEDILPTDVVWRKVKMGYPFPYQSFYKESEPIIKIIFEKSDNPYTSLFDFNQFKDNWFLISFNLWYEMFFNKNEWLFRAIEGISATNRENVDYGFFPQYMTTAKA